jgi:hypothetical protein
MAKISLKSIQNNGINQGKTKTQQKQVKIQVPKQSDKIVAKLPEDKPSFNNILANLQKNIVETKLEHQKSRENLVSQHLEKDQNEPLKALSDYERNKIIGLLHLYIAEFPDKLKTYKGKNFHKMTNKELLNIKDIFKKEVNTSNNLSMAVESSVKLLELYEYVCCDFMQVNIKGISKLGESQEYKDCVKAVLMKYFDKSLISCIEPEYKLMYLVISNTLLCHQLNSMETNKNKIKVITTKSNEFDRIPLSHQINENEITDNNIDHHVKEMMLKDVNMKYSDL